MHRKWELFGNILHITLNKSDPDAGGGLTGKYIACGSIACGVYYTTINTSQQLMDLENRDLYRWQSVD